MNLDHFRGVVVPIVNPCDPSDGLDEAKLLENHERLLAAPVRGLYINGGTGDAAQLTREERERVAELLLPSLKQAGRCAIVHVGQTTTRQAVALAEHAMALALACNRRIHKAYIRSKDFNFSLVGLTGMELKGKTVGVIGTGRIGQAFIDICKGFGMKILAFDKYPGETLMKDPAITYTQLESLFSQSDILSLHCPLTDETHHMINNESLKRCKNGVILLNTSRGALVDTEALLEGIKSRKVGAACLDVYEEESDLFFEDNSGHIVQDDTLARLITMPNVIVTSHQAFLTNEALETIAKTTIENLVELIATNHCKNELFFPM